MQTQLSPLLDTLAFLILLPEFLGAEKIGEIQRTVSAGAKRIAARMHPTRSPGRQLAVGLGRYVVSAVATAAAILVFLGFDTFTTSTVLLMVIAIYTFIFSVLLLSATAVAEIVFGIPAEEQSPLFRFGAAFLFAFVWPVTVVLFLLANLVSMALVGISATLQGDRNKLRPIYITFGVTLFLIARAAEVFCES